MRLFFPFIFVFTGVLFTQSYELWRNLKPGNNFDIVVIDDFENRLVWKMSNKLAIPSKLRYINRSPGDSDRYHYSSDITKRQYKNELFLLGEAAKLYGRSFNPDQKTAQELGVFVVNPGKDMQMIEPFNKEDYVFKGRPYAMSLWIFGSDTRHKLYAYFADYTGKKVRVEVSDLNFKGWRRVEVALPPEISRMNRFGKDLYEFRFEGLQFVSNPHEPKKYYRVMFDLITILINKSQDNYEGSEMPVPENWSGF